MNMSVGFFALAVSIVVGCFQIWNWRKTNQHQITIEDLTEKQALEAQRTNDLQDKLYKFSKETASQEAIRPIFEAMTTVAKIAGYDGRWKDADSLLAKVAQDFEWHLGGLKDYYHEFRQNFYKAYDLQKQKEKPLKGWERQELLPKFDELKLYFQKQVPRLVELFTPYLGDQGEEANPSPPKSGP